MTFEIVALNPVKRKEDGLPVPTGAFKVYTGLAVFTELDVDHHEVGGNLLEFETDEPLTRRPAE